MLPTRDSFHLSGYIQTEVKGWKKILFANENQKSRSKKVFKKDKEKA
jgi:hypothetical protein